MGFARLAESSILKVRGKSESETLGPMDKILSSSIGGALATWNQPIEVIRVEVCLFYRTRITVANIYPRCNPWPRGLPMPTDPLSSRS